MVDIDGVLSLFGFPTDRPPQGVSFCLIDGMPHFLSAAAAGNLLALADNFELVWCSGWEEKAEEYLPSLLGLPTGLPFLSFERGAGGVGASGNAHWKLAAIDAYADTRPLAWIDDSFNGACHAWASARTAPTLLVQTDPAVGLTEREADLLLSWGRPLGAP
jgi:hypothetical protein